MPLLDGCQFGCEASALSACQTPPPAVAPVDSDATKASAETPLGPTSCQLVFLPAGSLPMAFAAFAAACCCGAAMNVAGYALFSYASCAAPSREESSPPFPMPRRV